MDKFLLFVFLLVFVGTTSCVKRWSQGLETSHKASASKATSCYPTLKWSQAKHDDGSILNNITYDVAIYTVLSGVHGEMTDRGELVYYEEGLPNNYVVVNKKLEANQSYYWSVRTRHQDGSTSRWSTYSERVTLPGSTYGFGNSWFRLRTPKNCEV